MKLTSFKKFAAVSAVALSVASYAMMSDAAPVQIGSPVTVPVTLTVENTIDVATNVGGIDFGTLGAIRDLTDVATLVLTPGGVTTEDPGTGFGGADPAAIVFDPSDPPIAATVTVTTAFENTDLYVSYTTCVNPTQAGEVFILAGLADNLTTPGSNDCAGAATIGHGLTTVAGGLIFNVGASLSTTTIGATAYTDGAYAGSFNLVFSY